MLDSETITELTADVVAAYVTNNSLPMGQLADLIESVHSALAQLSNPAEPAPEKPTPAVNPKKSVFPDYIVCLDDGLQFRSLKRHLGKLGMTPEQYRIKWDLPASYPMTAPNYSVTRRELAMRTGLGRGKGKAPPRRRGKARPREI